MTDPHSNKPSEPRPRLLGWREWVALPVLGIPAIRAKIDTGARSSSLHVDSQEVFARDGIEWVRFSIHTGIELSVPIQAEARVVDRRPVTDSGGHTTERLFIKTRLRLAGVAFSIEINLASRRNMLFPMLLGRTALAGHFKVDPAHSFLHGEPSPQGDPA
jgi:hypothetical protein